MRLEFVRNLEMAMSGNVFSGELDLGSAGDIAFDDGADSGCGLIGKRINFVFLILDDAHNVVPLNSDVIGSAVFDDDFAVLVVVNGDE